AKNIYLTGYFRGTVDFGGGPITVPLDTDLDVFVAKFDTNGAHGWSKHFWNSGTDRGTAIAVAGGYVAVVGYFTNSINFNLPTITTSILDAGAPYVDAFVTKLAASDGAHVWSRRFGGSQDDQAYAVALDASNNVYVAGGFRDVASFGGGSLTTDF